MNYDFLDNCFELITTQKIKEYLSNKDSYCDYEFVFVYNRLESLIAEFEKNVWLSGLKEKCFDKISFAEISFVDNTYFIKLTNNQIFIILKVNRSINDSSMQIQEVFGDEKSIEKLILNAIFQWKNYIK